MSSFLLFHVGSSLLLSPALTIPYLSKRKFMIGELRRLLGYKEMEAASSAIISEHEVVIIAWSHWYMEL